VFRFESPSSFRFLWLVIGLLVLLLWSQRFSIKKLQRALGAKLTPYLTSSLSTKKRFWKRFLQLGVLVLMICALARPQMGESKQEIKSEGVEIVFLIDVSESMMAEDVRPNRLEQVKSEFSRFLEMMPGNKVGIVAFAGAATLLSPLTSDPNSLRLYLDSLSPISVSTQGTEFKRGLVEAREAFHRGGVGGLGKSDDPKATRVILLASDGEDHEAGAMDEAQKLVNEGIRIFALAYGTEKGAPIPERDNMGFLRGYKKDETGKTVLSQVHGDALRSLAQAGQGSFYHAAFGGDHMQKVAEDIGQLEKTQFESQMATNYDEKFQWVLLAALFIAGLEILLSERKAGFRLWRGRYEVPLG
jgi:Ca-activated chloride channel family protein